MAGILSTRFPEKVAKFFAYQATIVRAERCYDGHWWAVYDRQFRREALAQKDLNWSITDPRLYNEAFTGRAKAVARCTFCLREDHASVVCPCNPTRQITNFPSEIPSWVAAMLQSSAAHIPSTTSSLVICRRFNDQRCKFPRCRFRHACLLCGGPHPQQECRTQQCPRSRSPGRNQGKGSLAQCY